MTNVMDAVAAATADVPRFYPVGGVPNKPQYPYGVYSASLGRGDTYTLDDAEGVRWGRVVAQFFGRTADSAGAKYEEVRAALVGIALDVVGFATTATHAELDPTPLDRDPDDSGVVGLTATFTFTATEE